MTKIKKLLGCSTLLFSLCINSYCNYPISVNTLIHSREEQLISSHFSKMDYLEGSYYQPSFDESSDRKVQADDLTKNIMNPASSISNGIKLGNYKSDTWRGTNLIGRYMDINITSITEVTGIYSHYSSYFDHDILESGSASVNFDSEATYIDSFSSSFSFNFNVDYKVEKALEVAAGIEIADESAAVNKKYGASFNYNCNFTRNTMKTYYWSSHFSLSSKTAPYCPDGYSITIGKQGTYYYIEGNYQETSIWWWGDKPTQGTSKQYFNAIFATPDVYSYCFAYRNKLDKDSDYFKL